MATLTDISAADLRGLVKPGDRVIVGQGTAEARTLTRALVAQRHHLGRFEVFLGVTFSDSFPPDGTDGIDFTGYGAFAKSVALSRAGRLDPLPMPYSRLYDAFADGRLRADVVLLQVAPGREGRRESLSLAHDYTIAAARHARTVILEVNEDAPWTHGTELPEDLRVDLRVRAEMPPLDFGGSTVDETSARIGAFVADLVPEGATVQIGIGAIPDAVLAGLKGHRDLGIHSGVMNDKILDLIEAGVVTNARKGRDAGVTVANVLFGTKRLRDFAHDNTALWVAPPPVTHDAGVLASLNRLVAINSAIEVDLTGQVNSEIAGGKYVGAIGGQPDFVRGGLASAGGRSVIALPATAKGGTISRIVPQVANVSTPRCDADAIVTEYGVAELDGCTLRERARRMIEIAAPEFREDLARAAHAAFGG